MFLKVKEYKGQPITLAQKKYDGYYCEIIRGNGIVQTKVLLKGGDDISSLLHKPMRKLLQSIPYGTHLCGELYADGVPATSVVTLIKSGDERLKLKIFAMPKWAGQDCENWKLEIAFQHLAIHGFSPVHFRRFFKEPKGLNDHETYLLTDEARRKGWEGWVLKESHCKGWYKIKPLKTVDCFVISTTKSESESFYGGLKAIQVGVKVKGGEDRLIASVGSGFLAEYRMLVDRDYLIGRVCEVQYDCVAANGKLRFPRFVRWRDDEKKASECNESQL